jgi:enoyl-CoA hydratase/carnithine racemase
MSDEGALVLEERHGAVVVLTLNRPERHHALSRALSEQLEAGIARAEADPEARAIIITGSGAKAFCAGGDMLEMSGVEATARPAGPPPDPTGRISRSPLPVIAAINGVCYGGGARLAIACDIRLASETATFRLPGSEYGLVVAAASLPRLVGAAKAKELIFTARKFDAAEALACGLVTGVYPPAELLPAAMAMAETIAGHSAGAISAAKRVIDAASLSDAATAMENDANRSLRGSPEQVARFRSATQRVTGR